MRDWKYGDMVGYDDYNQRIMFLEYVNDECFKGMDKDGYVYNDFLIAKFKKLEDCNEQR